jgi:multiple sugar transport system permease protein
VAQPVARRAHRPFWNRRTKAFVGNTIVCIFMSALCFVFLIPLFWMVSTSLKTRWQTWIFPPVWIPNPIVWQNFPDVFRVAPFPLYVRNTLVLVFWFIVGAVLSNSVVSFGFSRVRFRGREFMFIVLLATLMIPGTVTMIPQFLLFRALGWYNTYLPLIVPVFTGSAFHIFLLRQYMRTLPLELDEAAKIDGANRFQIFYRIIMPLCKPTLTIVVVHNFMGAWSAFMGPIIYLVLVQRFYSQSGGPVAQTLPCSRNRLRPGGSVTSIQSAPTTGSVQ